MNIYSMLKFEKSSGSAFFMMNTLSSWKLSKLIKKFRLDLEYCKVLSGWWFLLAGLRYSSDEGFKGPHPGWLPPGKSRSESVSPPWQVSCSQLNCGFVAGEGFFDEGGVITKGFCGVFEVWKSVELFAFPNLDPVVEPQLRMLLHDVDWKSF